MKYPKALINSPSLLHKIVRKVKSIFRSGDLDFKSSEYWEQRYHAGGNSGSGSYNNLALFKAEVLNDFLNQNHVGEAMEFGCGDGNQLSLIQYKKYIGLDVSSTAINSCKQKFSKDSTKSFFVSSPEELSRLKPVDLTVSLDVLYHLIEDEVFSQYMENLFKFSSKYVIIYSSNINGPILKHERDRKFTDWVEDNIKDFKLLKKIPNRFPEDLNNPDFTSKADFYFYEKI